MNKLYKKIYEAINTGIQKALILDQDVSMNYKDRTIVNNSNIMQYYVDELLRSPNYKFSDYKQIIRYYEETGYTYKVKNFNELKSIIDKLRKFKKISYEWISNMKDYISIICEDNTEIYIGENTGKKQMFLKFANDDILGTENEILIYLGENHKNPKEEYRWQTDEVQIQPNKYLINDNKANKDYSGYETCLRIQKIISRNPEKYGNTPAIDYCLNLNENGYQGYLPTVGQLYVVFDNINIINYIFDRLNFNEINSKVWYQTANEANYNQSWLFYYGLSNSIYNKTQYWQSILPFFIKINN